MCDFFDATTASVLVGSLTTAGVVLASIITATNNRKALIDQSYISLWKEQYTATQLIYTRDLLPHLLELESILAKAETFENFRNKNHPDDVLTPLGNSFRRIMPMLPSELQEEVNSAFKIVWPENFGIPDCTPTGSTTDLVNTLITLYKRVYPLGYYSFEDYRKNDNRNQIPRARA
jgi:hypothetical protein